MLFITFISFLSCKFLKSSFKPSGKTHHPSSTPRERAEQGICSLPKRLHSISASHPPNEHFDVVMHNSSEPAMHNFLVPSLSPIIQRDSSKHPFGGVARSSSLFPYERPGQIVASSFATACVQNYTLEQDKLGVLLSAFETISVNEMIEINRLLIPPPQVSSDPPDPTVVVSGTAESLTHSNFASMRPGAWFTDVPVNYIVKVLVQPSISDIHCYDSFFVSKLRREKETHPQFSYNDVKR